VTRAASRPTPLGRLAWLLCGITVLLAGLQTWFFLGWSVTREDASSWPVLTLGLMLWAALGAVIISRHPRHRVAWLFVVGAVLAQLGNCLFDWDSIVTSGPSPDPPAVWPWAIWLGILLDAPVPLLFLSLLFLLFPTGQLPSARWRPLLWLIWVSFVGLVVAFAVLIPPWQITLDNRDEIFAEGWEAAPVAITLFLCLLVGLLAAAASVVVRRRHAHGVERQQLRWLAVAASMVAGCFVLAAFLPWETGVLGWVRVLPLQLSVVAVGVFAALAILRYRLYDLDLVVSRAILLTLSTAVVAVGWTLLVVVVGRSLPTWVGEAFLPSLLATAAVALAFQPLRLRLVRLADRLAFGSRAAPYEALADLGRNLESAPGAVDLLRNVAEAVGEATGARVVTAVLELPGGSEVAQTWPSAPSKPSAPVPASASPPPGPSGAAPGATDELVVRDRGERLGRVELVMPPGRPLRPAERSLVEGLLGQTAIALRNLRLETELTADIAELGRRTEALVESRRELVLARDEEKARFSAALHETVLPHLAPLPERLQATSAVVADGTGPQLDLQAERDAATTALDELRRLVRGRPQEAPADDQAASSRSGPNADLVT
jgi:hypothetical protein